MIVEILFDIILDFFEKPQFKNAFLNSSKTLKTDYGFWGFNWRHGVKWNKLVFVTRVFSRKVLVITYIFVTSNRSENPFDYPMPILYYLSPNFIEPCQEKLIMHIGFFDIRNACTKFHKNKAFTNFKSSFCPPSFKISSKNQGANLLTKNWNIYRKNLWNRLKILDNAYLGIFNHIKDFLLSYSFTFLQCNVIPFWCGS